MGEKPAKLVSFFKTVAAPYVVVSVLVVLLAMGRSDFCAKLGDPFNIEQCRAKEDFLWGAIYWMWLPIWAVCCGVGLYHLRGKRPKDGEVFWALLLGICMATLAFWMCVSGIRS